MEYRALGATGRRVSALGFGASPLGGAFGAVTQAQADAAVGAALDAGIDFFDTAPYYGDSEERLGRALAGVVRSDYTLCTKVGRYGPADFDFSAARVEASIDESLRRLRTDRLDVVYCHDIEFGDREQVIGEALPALRAAQAAGKVGAVGVSGLPLAALTAVAERAPLDLVLSYCHASLNDDSLYELLPFFAARGIGVVGASPLAMGLLTEAGPPAWHPAPEALKRACAAAASHCRTAGVDIAALALAWSVQRGGVASTLVGMADAPTVAANVRAASALPDPALLAEVAEILAPVQRVTWPSGRPENA